MSVGYTGKATQEAAMGTWSKYGRKKVECLLIHHSRLG